MDLKTAIAVAVFFAVCFLLFYRFLTLPEFREAKQMRLRLLCQTDHKALLEACRELSRRCARGELKPGGYNIRDNPHPETSETSRFPQVILDLDPFHVYIDENDSRRVMIIMHGGMDHFGVYAYTEDYKKPLGSVYGDKELIPGLWYYDEGYDYTRYYDKRIDALMKKGKQK